MIRLLDLIELLKAEQSKHGNVLCQISLSAGADPAPALWSDGRPVFEKIDDIDGGWLDIQFEARIP